MRFLRFTLLSAIAAVILSGCSDARESLGLGRSSPDEFVVVDRPPLSIPPDFGLRPPRPGAPRPQEVDPSTKASDALFGAAKSDSTAAADISAATGASDTSGAEQALLARTGATNANPNIRNTISAEASQKTDVSDHLVHDLLYGKTKDTGAVVDPAAEAARIKAAQAADKPLNQGATPIIERQQSSFLGL